MGLNKTIHEVVIKSDGTPTPFNVGTLIQGSKNDDIIRVRFENFDDTQELVAVLKAERGDGEKAPAGLLLFPNEIDGIVYYDFLIGQQEVDQEGIGSWFTQVAEDISFSVALIDNEQIKVKSQFKMEVEETPSFDETAEYQWDIIEGFIQALSLRPTFDYVDNINDTLMSLIETNQIDIVDLQNNKIDIDIITNLSIETDANKEDWLIIQKDGDSEVKRINLEDIKALVTKTRSVNDIFPDENDNITLVASDIPSNDGNLQTDINFSKSEDIRIENKFDEEVDRIDDDLDDATYYDKSVETTDPLLTVFNAERLNNKEEENLDVNSAKNVTEKIDGIDLTDIFEEDKTTVKNATNAVNAENATNATNATNAENATTATNATKVYDKNENDLRESMQDGTFDRIKLLEGVSIGTSPTTLDDELKDGDLVEIYLEPQSAAQPFKISFVYSSSNNDFEYQFISLEDFGDTAIGGETVYWQSCRIENKKITFPSSTTVTNEGLTDYIVGKVSLSTTHFSFAGSNNIDVKYMYVWRKKESE